MNLIKSIKYETKYNWYLPSQQFIMLVNNSFVFYGIKLTYLKIEKINKFEIVGIDHNQYKNNKKKKDMDMDTDTDSDSLFYSQITLIDIGKTDNKTGGGIGCIFIDERKTKLYLFRVIRHQMQLTHSYHLYSQGSYSIFHIDNVLVAYNRNTEMPILIDFNGNNYISAPLPIIMCYYEGNDPNKPKRIFSTSKHMRAEPPQQLPPQPMNINKNKKNDKNIINKKYSFISPLFILEIWTEKYTINNKYSSGNFYTLSLNLDAIVHSWGPERQIPLLHFLLHRKISDSKNIIIKMLYDMIKYYCLGYKFDLRSRLDFISEYFIVLNEVLRRAVEESASIIAIQQQQKQLLLQKKQENKNKLLNINKTSSFTARFRKQSQSYAQKLLGTPPSSN
eukprot:422233_1